MLAMMTRAITDPASVIPASIYDEWALKLPGPFSPIVISHPEDIRRVLLDKDENFGRNRQLRLLMRRAWGEGLAAATGDSWVAQRQAATPLFRPKAAEAAQSAMAQIAAVAAARWDRAQPLELRSAMGRIIIEIVMTVMLTGLDDPDYDQMIADIPVFVRAAGRFGLADFLPVSDRMIDQLRGIGRSPEEARLRALATRLAAIRAAPPDLVQDLPALLRGIGPLADNILGTLPAAYETSAIAVAWALYLLALYPDWQDAVRKEAQQSANDTDKPDPLPVARMVAQETLRLYPPAPLLARAATRRTSMRGHKLWPGQVVIIPVYAIHRHRQLWDRPDTFDPSRFAAGATYDRGAFLPFGAGPRLCIAAQFAVTEIAVVMSELVKRFRFTPIGPAPIVSLKISTHSTNGLNVGISAV